MISKNVWNELLKEIKSKCSSSWTQIISKIIIQLTQIPEIILEQGTKSARIIQGITTKGHICHKQMPVSWQNPKIVCLNFPLIPSKNFQSLSILRASLDVLNLEKDLRRLCLKLLAMEPNIILVNGHVDLDAIDVFCSRGITVAANIVDLSRIASFCNCLVLNDLTNVSLGYCKEFYVNEYLCFKNENEVTVCLSGSQELQSLKLIFGDLFLFFQSLQQKQKLLIDLKLVEFEKEQDFKFDQIQNTKNNVKLFNSFLKISEIVNKCPFCEKTIQHECKFMLKKQINCKLICNKETDLLQRTCLKCGKIYESKICFDYSIGHFLSLMLLSDYKSECNHNYFEDFKFNFGNKIEIFCQEINVFELCFHKKIQESETNSNLFDLVCEALNSKNKLESITLPDISNFSFKMCGEKLESNSFEPILKSEQNTLEYESVCVYFAAEFEKTRSKLEFDYQKSLKSAIKWEPKGGKSKSEFFKSLNLVIKQISKVELEHFLLFAPYYFAFLKAKYPTLLTKIYGLYKIEKRTFLVMQNILQNEDYVFDLKGLNERKSQDSEVLFEMDFLNFQKIHLFEESSVFVRTAIHNDTNLLSNLKIVDYSLLLGINTKKKTITLGIVDYIRSYTWDKKLENFVKELQKTPTIISPKEYKHRFQLFFTNFGIVFEYK